MSKGPKSDYFYLQSSERERQGFRTQTQVSLGWSFGGRKRLIGLLAIGTVFVLVWFTRESPSQFLQEAKDVAEKDPKKAERLLEKCLVVRPDFPEAQLLRCRVLGSLGYWEEAFGMFKLIKQPGALSGQLLLEFARHALNARQYSLAYVVSDVVRQADSTSSASIRLMLDVCLQQDMQAKSLELSRLLASLTPNDYFPWMVMARIYQDQNEPAKAVDAYLNALRCQPDLREQHQIRIKLVRVHLEIGEFALAREAIMPLLKEVQVSHEARLLDATILRYEGGFRDAVKAVQRILDEQPNLVPALYLRGVIAFDMARLDEARDDFLGVIQLEPRNCEAHYHLAQTYLRLGDAAVAEEVLLRAKELGEDAAELRKLRFRISHGTADVNDFQRFQELTRKSQEK